MTKKTNQKMKDRSHRYDTNRPRPRNGDNYSKYKMSLYNDGYMY